MTRSRAAGEAGVDTVEAVVSAAAAVRSPALAAVGSVVVLT